MGAGMLRHLRWPTAFAAVTCAICVSLLGGSPGRAASVPLSISIVGNHFVDGSGHKVRLLGVDRTSSEYACVDGYGYDDGHYDNADAAAIASWGANAVRIPLNEDCWLGINEQPNNDTDPTLTQGGYQTEIEHYVADLNAHGIYAILDLHWAAPGTQVPLEQQPMPDQDHSPAFWTSVAATFRTNPAVVFDLFNEPNDPTDNRSGDDQDSADKVTWGCWETGTKPDLVGGGAPALPCFTQAYDENGNPTTKYQIAGMQTLLDAVRNAGATQPVMTGGLDNANDLGDNDHGKDWMDHAPNDPHNQEAASFHNYMGEPCDTTSCWNGVIARIAAHVPVVTGEFAEDNFDEPKCVNKSPSTFDARYMDWADSAGVSYLAWAWIVESQHEQNADRCSAFVLINNYRHYTPAKPNGVAVYDHLRALNRKPPVRLTTFSASVRSGGTSVGFRLRSAQKSTGTLTGKTVHSYASAGSKPHPASLGSTHVTLQAGKAKTVVLKLPKPVRRLLLAKHSLKVRITITLTSAKHRRTVIHRTVTLRT
jgi:endoglucanase